MSTTTDTLAKIEQFKELLLRRATGASEPDDSDKYVALRRELIAQANLLPILPVFIQDHRTLSEFWGFIKNLYPSYQERREYLRREFASVLRDLEKISLTETVNPPSADLFKHQFPAGLPFGAL